VATLTDSAVSFVARSCGQCSVGLAQPDCDSPAVQTRNNQYQSFRRPVYILRIEKPLTSDDVPNPRGSIADEFGRRARENATEKEVWSVVDPEDGSLVDLYAPETDEE